MTRLQQSPLTIGRVVDARYEVTRTLSHGASGTVYHAEVVEGDSGPREVALKVLHEKLYSDRQIFGRFHREARILQRLHGPHLARLLDFIEEEGLLILVLEYIDGPSLERRLEQDGPLTSGEATDIALQLCEALQAAHDAGVIHRDLKPSNVLLEGWSLSAADAGAASRPLVKVVDFGLAKILHGDQPGTALTEQDMIFGTPDYMSPEQVRGDELDHRCDIYALGAMLFQMLVGDVPFRTAGPLTTMSAHLKDPVPSPRSAAPERDIPMAIERVVMRALSKDRAQRQPSARALAEELAEARSEAAPDVDDADKTTDDDVTDASDTEPDPQRLSNPIGTTLKSHRVTGLDEAVPRGAKVLVQVEDAAPVSSDKAPSRPFPRPTSRRSLDSVTGRGERRFWTIAALIAAAVAVAVGILFGIR